MDHSSEYPLTAYQVRFGMDSNHPGASFSISDEINGTPTPTNPSTLEMIVRLAFIRWKVLIVLALIGSIATYGLVQKYGKQHFQVDGTMIYSVPDDYVQKRIFPTPKPESILQRITGVIPQVRKEFPLPISEDVFRKQLLVQFVKGSDYISISFETADISQATKMIDRLMELAKELYLKSRNESFEQALSLADAGLKAAKESQREALEAYQKELDRRKISDPKFEQAELSKEIAKLSTQVKELTNKKPLLEKKIESLGKEIDKLTKRDSSDPKVAPKLTPEQEQQLATLKGEMKIMRDQYLSKLKTWETTRRLAERKIVPLNELRQIEDELREMYGKIELKEQAIKFITDNPGARILVQEGTNTGVDILGKARNELREAKTQLELLPIELATAQEDLKEKKEKLDEVSRAVGELEPYQTAIAQAGTVLIDRTKDRAELTRFRSMIENPNTSELKIASAAQASPSSSSSNYAKIAAAVFGILILLFLGFIVVRDLPQATKLLAKEENRIEVHQVKLQNLTVPMLGHFVSSALKDRLPPLPPTTQEQLQSVATGIAQQFKDPGSIILFTPMGDGVRVENLVSELSRYYSNAGENVLLFDARGIAQPPGLMPMVPGNTAAVDSYLDGEGDPSSCFAPTQLPAVEYTRGDISQHIANNEKTMTRFQELLEEMRQRYTRVLMIAPVAQNLDEVHRLSTFSEGVVLVVNDRANPTDVHSYVDALKKAETPVFGTVVVGSGVA